ncbi:putative RNA-directed DNA polymerase [Rosa chinensis]|uniref:Putative RNA-directed DNA polymerase n=1 Tax=Rosa chinensis TaxID=74649 RepID=A0A2P6QAL2_ROSCH|nr:putative RNA-directed DNA polymerase [Rosa chinensis]
MCDWPFEIFWKRERVGMSPISLMYVCLIPKIKTDASHFHLIALCNVIYRICSKVVANRLKKWLPEIISPLQSAYVLGRLISDNTLVAIEVAHFMYKLRTQAEGFFSLKLDISKAYDHLEWSFLQAILTKLGFASN